MCIVPFAAPAKCTYIIRGVSFLFGYRQLFGGHSDVKGGWWVVYYGMFFRCGVKYYGEAPF